LTVNWRKSTYSGGSEGACVEVGSIPWRKSTHSGGSGGACLEAGSLPGRVFVRDTTQHGDGPVVSISIEDWRRLTAGLR